MNKNLVKTKSGKLYEIHSRVLSSNPNAAPVLACFAISEYDGMPIGSLVWIGVNEFIDADRDRTMARLEDIPKRII